jgi:hypothetical protein
MRSFTIAFEGDDQDKRQIEFVAQDPRRAFSILELEGFASAATLLEEGRPLGVLRRSPSGFWQFTASGAVGA